MLFGNRFHILGPYLCCHTVHEAFFVVENKSVPVICNWACNLFTSVMQTERFACQSRVSVWIQPAKFAVYSIYYHPILWLSIMKYCVLDVVTVVCFIFYYTNVTIIRYSVRSALLFLWFIMSITSSIKSSNRSHCILETSFQLVELLLLICTLNLSVLFLNVV